MEIRDCSNVRITPQLIELLSWPADSAPSRAAAMRLSQTCSATEAVNEIYLSYGRHKTLFPVMRHMEATGTNLEVLSFPTTTFLSKGNMSRVLTGTHVREQFTSLSRVRSIYHRLDQLLSELEANLVARFEGRLMLVYGRALKAVYPNYSFGYSHDLDFFGLDTSLPNEWLRAVTIEREFSLEASARSLLRNFARIQLLKHHEDGFLLKADLIVGGRLGSEHIPPFTLDPLPKARMVRVHGRVAFVPSPEDMILMVAEKMRRHAVLLRRHFNDVRYLVLAHEHELDWDYISRAASRHRLIGMMRVLTDDMRRQEGREFVPPSLLGRPRPSAIESRMVSTMTGLDPHGRWLSRPRTRRRLWRLYWYIRHLRPTRDAFHMIVDDAFGYIGRSRHSRHQLEKSASLPARAHL